MIIVLLLFFQSICRFCQRMVLHIHDRWINPKNVRLLNESEEKVTLVKRHKRRGVESEKLKNNTENSVKPHIVTKKRYTNSVANKTIQNKRTDKQNSSNLNCAFLDIDCRFCTNSPQGYCRHHLHLQELQVQRYQQNQCSWNPLAVKPNTAQEYRELRKINRELRQTLKNRLNSQQQQFHNIHLNGTTRTTTTTKVTADNLSNFKSEEDSGYSSVSNGSSPIETDPFK